MFIQVLHRRSSFRTYQPIRRFPDTHWTSPGVPSPSLSLRTSVLVSTVRFSSGRYSSVGAVRFVGLLVCWFPQVDVYASVRSAVSPHVRQPVSLCMTLALFPLPVPLATTLGYSRSSSPTQHHQHNTCSPYSTCDCHIRCLAFATLCL